MIVRVKLFASLRRYRPELTLGQTFACTAPDNSTVEKLIVEVLRLPLDEVAISLVNGVYRDRAFLLSDGDMVSLWPPIAGGGI